MSEYDFNFVWSNPPRTIKKSEWRAVQRYLRLCRNVVQKEFDSSNMRKHLMDALLYGTGYYTIGD